MLLNAASIIIYFLTREHNDGWVDTPIISSLFAAGTALLIAAAILGQFTYDHAGNVIIYAGLGAFYGMVTAIMFIYWLLTTGETLYKKTLGRTL
jgi:hypothetical protein